MSDQISKTDVNQKIADVNTILLQAVPSPLPALNPVGTSTPGSKKKINRVVLIISVFFLVVFVSGGSLFVWNLLKKSATSVTLYQANLQNVTRSIGGNGQLFAAQTLDISYPLVEQVVAVNVKPGDSVSINQSLVRLDVSQLNSQVKQASDDVKAAQNYLNSVAGTLQAPDAQRQYDVAVARYNSLVAQASSPTLHNGTIISPLKGRVVSVAIQPGEVAAANSTLMTLAVDSTLVAHVQIPLLDLSQVYVGQSAVVTPSALLDQTFHGLVSTIIPQASANSDTFEVWVNVNNDKKSLLANMNVFVSLQEPLHTIVVPRLAVLNPDHGSIVFVVHNGHAYVRHVQVGGYAGDKVIISGGLIDGDRVVMTGLDTLKDGEPVTTTSIEHP